MQINYIKQILLSTQFKKKVNKNIIHPNPLNVSTSKGENKVLLHHTARNGMLLHYNK